MDKQKEKSVRALLKQRQEQFRKEEEAHKKELEELERQARMEDGKKTTEVMMAMVCGDDHVRERLGNFSVEEGKLIGKRIIMNFDKLVEKSMDDITKYREEKTKRDERRKARQAQKKAEQSTADSERSAAPQTEPKPEQRPAMPVQQVSQGYGNPGRQVATQTQPSGGIRYAPGAQQ